jgi:hypothetical protein
MDYPHKLSIKQIPVPRGSIQTIIESDVAGHTVKKEFYATQEEFLAFWKPLVDYYEGVKIANSIQNG